MPKDDGRAFAEHCVHPVCGKEAPVEDAEIYKLVLGAGIATAEVVLTACIKLHVSAAPRVWPSPAPFWL
jgi:hypothetical protein